VESSVSTNDALIRPWRTATLVASAVAVLELCVLLAIAFVYVGPSLLDWAQSSSTKSSASAARKAKHAAATASGHPAAPKLGSVQLARTQTSVLVLNGNGIAGAAASEAAVVQRKGYVLANVGNAPRSDYARSIVMYRPGFKPEAVRLARDAHIGIVSPLDGLRRGDLFGAHVAIVIGAR
jgi:hypothetical protein